MSARWLPFAALAVVLAPARAAAQAPFFQSDSVLEFTIRADLRTLLRDRDPDTSIWRGATISWQGADGPASVPLRVLRVRTRGVFRLRECDFPPIRLRFSDDSVRGTPWEGLRRPKLATHCMNREGYDQNVLQEYAIYRVLRLFTPASYAARLARVTWEDSTGRSRPVTRYAFLTEDPERFAERLGGSLLDTKGILMTWLTPQNAALLGVFQYFVANTDWSVPALHNIELLRTDTVIAVPYDFDWSGVINAPYARPAPQLRIRSVTQRVYRGLCQDSADLEPVLARFEALRDSIAAIYRGIPGMEPRTVERSLRYYEEFYRDIADRRRFFTQVVRRDCLRHDAPDLRD
jgi:hypothetical protein